MIDTGLGVVAQFNAEPDIQAVMGSNYIGLLNNFDGLLSVAQQLAAQTINRVVYRDNPQLNQTLQSINTPQAINEVLRQMKIAGATVQRLTIAGTVAASYTTNAPTSINGTGNGIATVSVVRALDGQPLENANAETLSLTCTSDSFIGNSVAGNEPMQVTGDGDNGPMAFDWPLGSNSSTQLNAIDGNSSNSAGNILTNSGFETWAGGVPSNFTIITNNGTIAQETGIIFDPTNGGSAMRITGDGSTLTTFSQAFNSSAGTLGTLSPLTQYSFAIWLRRDGIPAGQGQMVVEIVDGNGNVIKDINNVSNSLTIDLTALNTIYTPFTLTVRMPLALATADYYVRFRETVALTNARSVYLDKGSLGLMTQAYVGGPFVAYHSGSIPLVQGDFASIAITNSRGTGATALSQWQTVWAVLFPDAANSEILLPSSSVPSISNTLIG